MIRDVLVAIRRSDASTAPRSESSDTSRSPARCALPSPWMPPDVAASTAMSSPVVRSRGSSDRAHHERSSSDEHPLTGAQLSCNDVQYSWCISIAPRREHRWWRFDGPIGDHQRGVGVAAAHHAAVSAEHHHLAALGDRTARHHLFGETGRLGPPMPVIASSLPPCTLPRRPQVCRTGAPEFAPEGRFTPFWLSDLCLIGQGACARRLHHRPVPTRRGEQQRPCRDEDQPSTSVNVLDAASLSAPSQPTPAAIIRTGRKIHLSPFLSLRDTPLARRLHLPA